MALEHTVYGVKRAIRDLIHTELNAGLAPDSPEYVDVFYGWNEVDSPNRIVVVDGGETDWSEGAEQFHADSSLWRYGMAYTVNVEIATSFSARTQEDAEREAYALYDRVLTPLIRGDERGRSLLTGRIRNIEDVQVAADYWRVVRLQSSDNQIGVLTCVLRIELTRE